MFFGVLAAGLFYLSFPNPWSQTGFECLAYCFAIPLFIVLENKSLGRRMIVGLFFGLAAFLSTFHWLRAYSVPGYFLLSTVLSIQPVVFCLLYRTDFKWPLLAVPGCWVVSEWVRKGIMMGQSWDLAHSQTFNLPVLQLAALLGSAAISFFLLFMNYGLYRIFHSGSSIKEKQKISAAMVSIFILTYAYGFWVLSLSKSHSQYLTVGAIQPNTDFRKPWTDDIITQILDQNIDLTEQMIKTSRPNIVIWPETAIPDNVLTNPQWLRKIQTMISASHIPLIMGAAIGDNERVYNAALYFDEQGQVASVYFKNHLIPLTEYIPEHPFWQVLAKGFHVQTNGFSRKVSSPIFKIGEVSLLLAICSEDNISAHFKNIPKSLWSLGIVLLNDSWFYEATGMIMHGQHSMMRAVENGIAIVRVSNNGWSCWIDPQGRASQQGLKGLQKKASYIYYIPIASRKTKYHFLYDTFCLLCLGFVIINYRWIFLKRT